MFRNYLTITLRNLKKHKGYSLINIAGLVIGMACCILILLYVTDEVSFDRFHDKGDRIYRVNAISSIGATSRHYAHSPPALSPVLAETIPEVESQVRLFDSFDLEAQLEGEPIRIPDTWFVDDTIFDVFTFPFVAGDSASAFSDPDTIVITEQTAARLFGDEEALGKVITLPPDRSLRISGVVEDVPINSHFQFQGLIPTTWLRDEEGRPAPVLTADYFCEVYSFIVLREDADIPALEKKIASTVESRWGEMYRQRGTSRQYPLIRLHDIHLRSHYEYEMGTPGDIDNVVLFSGIALLVLLIACFNFINLSTARSAGRAREVGIRKVFGSQKRQLIRQFLSESVAVSLISLFLAVSLVLSILPLFNNLAGKQFGYGQLLRLPVLLGLLGIIILTGLIAGSFPAFILSAFHPVMVLKGKFSSASKNSTLRRILVVVQFSISIFLLVGILTMVRQLDYIKNKDLGFQREQLVAVEFFGGLRDEESTQRYESLKARIQQHPGVVSVSFSANIPGAELGYDAYLPEGNTNDEAVRARNYWVDFDFVKTFGMEIVWGRDFSREFSTDAGEAVIINERMAEALGWGKDSLGKLIYNVPRDNRLGRIVGIVKDFHSGSLKLAIRPVTLSLEPRFFAFVTARIQPVNVSETLAFLEDSLQEVHQAVRPDREFNFNYHFVDDDFRNKYGEEEKVRQIYIIFGCLAVFIACLGLFGLASFTVEQRTKEIGVRKILGARLNNIVSLLSLEFTKLVLIANVLAWPLAYYAMHRWLGNFAYRIGIGFDIFVFSGVLAAVVAVITVMYHSVRAALLNPVDSLRYE
jgi:putative ABC transport system permease protein